MEKHTKNIRLLWEQRQKRLGNSCRSVLFKNLPDFLNNAIHIAHTRFVLNNLKTSASYVLDVGCGYGRIAHEIVKAYPNIHIQGVELCKPFADKFSDDLGECFIGSIQEYTPTRMFDAIIIITVLMYIDVDGLEPVITRLWHALNPYGRMICIEPSTNYLIKMIQRMVGRRIQPTGEDVIFFSKNELTAFFQSQKHANLVTEKDFGLVPLLNRPTLHHGVVFEKKS